MVQEKEMGLEELKRLLKKEAFLELLNRYREAMNENRWTEETAKRLFTEDSVLEPPMGDKAEGCQNIASAHKKMTEPFMSALHSFSDSSLKFIDDQRAAVQFQMTVFHQFSPEKAAFMAGDLFIVRDQAEGEVVWEDDSWKFRQLQLHTVYKMMAVEQGPGGPKERK